MLKYRCFALVLAGILCWPGSSRAEQVRFRFIPLDACGNTRQVAIGPEGAMGQKLTGLGLIPRPFPGNFRPTHMVTFRHPFSNKNIIVPLAQPAGNVRMEYRADRILYHFESYDIEVIFLQDGSAEVVYFSGFLRPLNVQ